jgi:2-polyprenyl-6-hydroxyphenyl methylase/3-demethylubiquinone-9 3-methyltransferase
LTYKNTSLEALINEKDLSNADHLYDVVCCSEVVEHVANQADFLRDCAKLVKPNSGYLYISTIAKTPESYLLTIACKFQCI